MCGIVGIWQRDGSPIDLRVLSTATLRLRHRGPNDEGYLLINTEQGRVEHCGGRDTDKRLTLPPLERFFGEKFDFAFGFRRLAILDLSMAGHQPMVSSDGRYWMIYNGEVYNYLELRKELSLRNHLFKSTTDTEVVLEAHAQWGPDSLRRFNGMWAFAIWDRQEQSLFLARDRFGIKPLFYATAGATFIFASEAKAIVGAHAIPFRPNEKAIYNYLVGRVLPNPQQPDTFFEDVFTLQPGHSMHVTRQGLALRQYWQLQIAEEQEAPKLDVSKTILDYRTLFTDAVNLHLRADVAVGSCLSGGLDSSSIVCTINELLKSSTPLGGQQQHTFSAVYHTAGRYNERNFIEQIVAATPVNGHFTFPTAEGLLADLHTLVWHQDEPALSSSIFAQWCVMEDAQRQGVTVLLDGQGADESLAGYRPFGVLLYSLLRAGRLTDIAAAMQMITKITGVSRRTLLQQMTLAAVPDAPLMQLRKLGWRIQGDSRMLQPDFVHQWAGTLGEEYPYAKANNLGEHLRYKVMVSLPELLRYEDRNSMAHSIEARVPFLDYRLVEFSFNQAADLRLHSGWTKWILRKAMEGIVPTDIVWRKDKVGFETPQNEWLQTLLRQEVNFFTPQALSRDMVNVKAIHQQLPALLHDKNQGRSFLWSLLNLEIWLRVWQRAATAT